MPKIKNLDSLSVTNLRAAALQIAEAALKAIDTKKIISEKVQFNGTTLKIDNQEFDVSGKKIYVCGIGKCALTAAAELEHVLSSEIHGGVVIGVTPGELKYSTYIQGTHPLPSVQNASASENLISFFKDRKAGDLTLFVVSGGGSVLLSYHPSMQYTDESMVTQVLFEVGASISEMNILRKHLSSARGGNLAALSHSSELVGLIFSDVPGNEINSIASGPTVLDATTREDALLIIKRYELDKTFKDIESCVLETPKDEKLFSHVTNKLLLTNIVALNAMKLEAEKLGWSAEIKTDRLEGEVKNVVHDIVGDLRKSSSRTILLYGGETTIRSKLNGNGGRNQELAMLIMPLLLEDECVVSLATDGRDHSDVAGAVADVLAYKTVRAKNRPLEDIISQHLSMEFCSLAESAVISHDTGSNVSDLIIAVKR